MALGGDVSLRGKLWLLGENGSLKVAHNTLNRLFQVRKRGISPAHRDMLVPADDRIHKQTCRDLKIISRLPRPLLIYII